METVAAPAELPQSPEGEAASAWLEEILGDMTALSELSECAMIVARDLAQRATRGEVDDPVTKMDRITRAVRRTIALKMRLRAEMAAAMRGRHMMPRRAATVADKKEDLLADSTRPEREAKDLLNDLYDRPDATETGDEIGNTPSVEVYRSVCLVLGITPDETRFVRKADTAPAGAAAACAAPGAVAVMERPRAPDEADRKARDWPRRAGNGRDPPESG